MLGKITFLYYKVIYKDNFRAEKIFYFQTVEDSRAGPLRRSSRVRRPPSFYKPDPEDFARRNDRF